jgi:phage shock protein PspC (stress-responsive transcriptional regulator)
METKRTLYRNTDNRILGGVASGFAEYMDWDITLVRLVLVVAFFTIPGALFAYLWLGLLYRISITLRVVFPSERFYCYFLFVDCRLFWFSCCTVHLF